MPEAEHDHYLVSSQNMEYLRGPIGMDNEKVRGTPSYSIPTILHPLSLPPSTAFSSMLTELILN